MKITFEEKGIKTTFYSFKEFKKYIKEKEEKEKEETKNIWEITEDNFKEYWYIDTGSAVSIDKDINWCSDYSEFENDRMNGNAFLTEEEAIKELEKRRAITRVMKWKHENGMNFEPDWEDDNEEKNFIVYNIKRKVLDWDDTDVGEYFPPTGYFKTLEDLKKCIKECREYLEIIYKD